MAYTPTIWKIGDTITAEKLNKLEEGIEDFGNNIVILNGEKDPNNPTTSLIFDKTLEEITELFQNGATLICKVFIETQSVPGGTLNTYLYLPMSSYTTYSGEISAFQFYGFAEMYLYYVIIGQTGATYYKYSYTS